MELVALLPALVLIGLVGWQMAMAGYAWILAGGAARAGARAAEVGAPARDAALRSLPEGYARGARAMVLDSRPVVRIRLVVPRVVPFIPRLASVEAEALVRR